MKTKLVFLSLILAVAPIALAQKKKGPPPPPVPCTQPPHQTCNSASGAGCLDETFGADQTGIVTVPSGLHIYGIATQTIDNKEWIVAVGYMSDLSGKSRSLWTVVRYDLHGRLDTTFGGAGTLKPGIVQAAFGGNGSSVANAVLIQPGDNKIIVVGSVSVQKIVQNVSAIARYNADGTPDNSFGTLGKTTVPVAKGYGSALAVAIQSDKKIVTAGCLLYPCSMGVIRLDPAGKLDPTFNPNWKFSAVNPGVYLYDPYPSQGNAIVIQKVGTEERIVIAGTAPIAGNYGYRAAALFRLNSVGELDTTFGDLENGAHKGVALTHFGPTNYDLYESLSLLRDSTNRLLAVGEGDGVSIDVPYRMIVARYNPDGSLDPAFSGGGMFSPEPRSGGDSGHASVFQSDGKFLVSGGSQDSNGTMHFASWRFLDTGNFDTTFGLNGFVSLEFGGLGRALAITLQSDGKILAGGHATLPGTSCYVPALTRQLP